MRPLLIFLLIAFSLLASAQDTVLTYRVFKPVTSEQIYETVGQMSDFPGGEVALIKFLQMNIEYPDYARENSIKGRVVVGFIVNQDGSISDVSIKKGVSKELNAEAVRVVKLLPRFKPVMQGGKAVKVQFMIPIEFKLSN